MKALDLLGMKVVDKVTGFKGVVTSVSFDLFGCVQALINPGLDKDGKRREDVGWYDTNRLHILDKFPVMDPPRWGVDAGPEDKPLPGRR